MIPEQNYESVRICRCILVHETPYHSINQSEG
jgi:hypothetical protein